MRIGIILYSQTGNTLSVAERIRDRLTKKGHTVKIDKVLIKGEPKPGDKEFEFEHTPVVKGYDAIIFGAPVHAFSLALPMRKYLEQIDRLDGKNVALLSTKHLYFKWTGGGRAIRAMKNISRSKGASVKGSGIVVWLGKDREKRIDEVTERISSLF